MNNRILSIDVLRGFDMMFIMGIAAIITASCALFPGGESSWLAEQMEHVSWNGLHHQDTIFPLFLFISGMTFPFSCTKRLASGASRRDLFLNTLRRGLILFALGLMYNGFFRLEFCTLRIPSVLGRIGLAWMFAGWIFLYVGRKWRWVIAAAILVGYNLLLLIPAPDVSGFDSFSREGNIVGYIDRLLIPGHFYKHDPYFDPEGLLSTLPAIVTAMLGQFTGEFIGSSKSRHKTGILFGVAALLLVLGLVWSLWMPVNKALWTSPFVLLVGAYSVACFAIFYWMIDVRGWTRWTSFFTVIGKNSITIYLAQAIIPFTAVSEYFFGGLAGRLPAHWSGWILAVAYFAVSWLFLLFLHRHKIYLKV